MRILHIKNTKRIRKRKNFLIFQNRDLEIPRMEILGDDLRVGGWRTAPLRRSVFGIGEAGCEWALYSSYSLDRRYFPNHDLFAKIIELDLNLT